MKRTETRSVRVGDLVIGGNNNVIIQSMCSHPTKNVEEVVKQILELEAQGCQLIRVSCMDMEDAAAIREIRNQIHIPLVADIHFDYRLALAAIENGADKIRLNPGNIGGLAKTDLVIDAARGAGIPIRIGVNAGSLEADLAARTDLTLPEKLMASATEYVRFFEDECDFRDIVVSAKAHDVQTTIGTYRLLASALPQVPLHIGVTEAGTAFQGIIKSACGLGVLLEEGIGDTMRISLTDDPVLEVRAAWQLLGALGLRARGPEIISCPTCGRCQVDLISIAKQVEERLASVEKPLKVAVMGCVVNGPGEAKDADVGIAAGAGVGALFRNGRIVRKVDEADIVEALMQEIESL